MPEERPPLKPVQSLSQLHDLTDDHHHRRTQFLLRGDVANRGQRALKRLLGTGGATADNRRRGIGRQTVADQGFGDQSDTGPGQQDDFGPRSFRHLRPVNAVPGPGPVFVACKQRKLGSKLAMGQWNPSVVGCCHQG